MKEHHSSSRSLGGSETDHAASVIVHHMDRDTLAGVAMGRLPCGASFMREAAPDLEKCPPSVLSRISRGIREKALLRLVQELAPGFYTERDGFDWYIVTPDHGDRIGEDFREQKSARMALAVVAGADLPKGWRIDLKSAAVAELFIPGQYSEATLWVRSCERHFPGRLRQLADVLPEGDPDPQAPGLT